jgi:hypothetical protein
VPGPLGFGIGPALAKALPATRPAKMMSDRVKCYEMLFHKWKSP